MAHACDLANQVPDLNAIEQDFDALPSGLHGPWHDAPPSWYRFFPRLLASPPLLARLDCVGQLRAASKQRLDRRMGAISSQLLDAVENALRQILEL
ncbi:MAG: hypothetical protein Q8N47_07815 [Bryobacterales bacterium]|nr:hypothetical protein [Bryobacterales bacterium]